MSARGRGVLYVATGAAHAGAARLSAQSVRRTNPELAIGIFSDMAEPGPEFDWSGPIAGPHARSKIDHLGLTPFAETLYLDTDTRVLGPLDDLFRLLERFEIGAAHVAAPHSRGSQAQWRHEVPKAFPQLNSGVLLYRTSPAVVALFGAWREAYHDSGHKVDQITLRDLIWLTDIRLATLHARYNTRRYTWIDHWFSRQAKPVILHTNRLHPTKHGPWRRRLAALSGPSA